MGDDGSGQSVTGGADDRTDVVLRVPESLRAALREPLGPIEPDMEAVLGAAGRPLVTVGDVVTYRAEAAGATPDVGIVDGRTQRSPVDPDLERAPSPGVERVAVVNPAGTLTAPLLGAIRTAIESEAPHRIVVDGEEDLATLPAVHVAPDGASLCYGQPDAGVVHVRVDTEARRRVRELLAEMEGDHDRVGALLDGRGDPNESASS